MTTHILKSVGRLYYCSKAKKYVYFNNSKIMNAIQLTEEHKARILEMCKILFPKHKFELEVIKQSFTWNNTSMNVNAEQHRSTELITIMIEDSGDTDSVNSGIYHWFEFCLTTLAEKIFFNVPLKRNAMELYLQFVRQMNIYSHRNDDPFGRHPIDYIYEEFEKLKL